MSGARHEDVARDLIDLPVEELRLDNGLTVLFQPHPKSEVLSIMLWVPAGVRTERPGQSGISHFVEHCYSLGSARLEPREIDRVVQELGGTKNAFTSYDYTAYYENLPAGALERIIDLEADRFTTLAFPEEAVRTELEVVKEERRLRADNTATGQLNELLFRTAYSSHPYRFPIVGLAEDIETFTPEIARAYFREHYRPENCTFIVSGGVDVDQASRWFEQAFDGPKGPATRPPAIPDEPEQVEERRVVTRRDITSTSYVSHLYKGVPFDHPDAPALSVLSTVLLGGRASRLQRRLMRELPLATNVSGGFWAMKDPGPFMLMASVRDGVACGDVESVLDDAIDEVRTRGVTEGEVERARARRLLGKLSALESTKGRAHLLGIYQVMSERGWRALGDSFDRIRSVRREDVERVAVEYLDPSKRTVAWQHPPGDTPEPRGEGIRSAPLPDIDIPRRPGPVSPSLAADALGDGSYRLELPNGAVLLYRKSEPLPLVAIAASTFAGAAYDPPNRRGLASLTSDLLRSGTRAHDEEAHALAFAGLGTGLSISAGLDTVHVRTTVRSEDLAPGMRLMTDVLLRPELPESAVDRLRSEHLSARKIAWSRPSTLLHLGLIHALFGEHPYGSPVSGTPSGIAAIDRAAVAEFYARTYRPEQTVLAVTGRFSRHRLEGLFRELYSDWSADGDPVSLPPIAEPPFTGAVSIAKDGQTQAHVELGQRLVSRTHPDWDALVLFNAVLGAAGLVARIPARVRTREGLAYAARSALSSRQLTGVLTLSAQTKVDSVGRTLSLMREETEKLLDEGVTEDELNRIKARLEGTLPFRTETMAARAAALLTQERYGLGVGYLRRQIDDIVRITPDELLEVARRHIEPSKFSQVVVAPTGDQLESACQTESVRRLDADDFDR